MELAKAYVQIIPSADGISGSITNILSGEADSAGKSAGVQVSQGFASTVRGVATIGAATFAAVSGTAAAVTGAFVSGAGSVAAYGDNIDKISQKMGMSAQTYQEWDAVMQHSGTSMEAMKASMKTLANAAETNSEAFDKLGISQEELQSLSQEQLFERTIAALQDVGSETERTYLAGKVLGRGATELGALLNTSAEDTQAMRDRVHELGGVMSDDAVKAAAAYQDSLQDMQTAFSGVKIRLLSDFLPGIKDVMDGMTEIFAGNSGEGISIITGGIQSILSGIGEALPELAGIATRIITAIAQTFIANLPLIVEAGIRIIAALGSSIFDSLPLVWEAMLGVGETIIGAIAGYGPSILEQGWGFISGLAQGIVEGIPGVLERLREFLEQMYAYLSENLPGFLQSGVEMVSQFAAGVVENVPAAIESIGAIIVDLINFVADNLPQFIDQGITLASNIAAGILSNLPEIISTMVNVFADIITTIAGHLPDILAKGIELIGQLAAGIIRGIPDLIRILPEIFANILNVLGGFDWPSIGMNLILGIAKGVIAAARELVSAVLDTVASAWDAIVGWLDIRSPSHKAENFIGINWGRGVGVGFEKGLPGEEMIKTVSDTFNDIAALKPKVNLDAIVKTREWEPPERRQGEQGKDGDILDVLLRILAAIELIGGLTVVLDDGTIVGKILPLIDDGLGTLAARRARG